MIVQIAQHSTPDIWHLGGSSAFLRIYANATFKTNGDSGDRTVMKGNVANRLTFYKEVPCTIVANVLTIPAFTIDSTEDSPTNPQATYSAYLFTSSGKQVAPVFLANFRVPDTLDSQTWTTLELHQNARIPVPTATVYDVGQVENLFSFAIVRDRGVAEMVNGSVIVENSRVKVTSLLLAFSMDAGIRGTLRCQQDEVAEDESFIIRSSDEGDSGAVVWFMYNG